MEKGYEVRLQPEARNQLDSLDEEIRRRVWDKLEWLGENAEQVQHYALTGDLSGLFKRRVGSYRIVYELLPKTESLVAHRI